ALGRLHHLADEPAEDLVVAALELRDLAGVAGDDLIYQPLYLGAVADLPQALGLDNGAGLRAALPHLLEDLLGDAPGDGAVGDEVEQAAQLAGIDRCILQAGAAAVQRSEVVADQPVRRQLGVAALGN